MKSKKEFVKKQDNIADVIREYPESAEIFLAYGLHCVGGFANSFDSILAGAEIHGMAEEELNDMVKEVNYVIDLKQESKNAEKKPTKYVKKNNQ